MAMFVNKTQELLRSTQVAFGRIAVRTEKYTRPIRVLLKLVFRALFACFVACFLMAGMVALLRIAFLYAENIGEISAFIEIVMQQVSRFFGL